MSKEEFYIWEGIYDRFTEEDPDGVFECERWIDQLQRPSELESGGTISPHTLIHDYPLAPVAAVLASALDIPIRILDFGGGLGSSYFPLITSLPAPDLVEFHIVERPAVCQRGKEAYHEFDNLHFHDEMPRDIKEFHLVHAAAALHYVADWRTMLERFTAYKPRYLMLSGLTAGDIRTFVTYQKYYGSRIPVWFWNVREIIDTVGALGYKLIYKSLMASSYLGKVQPLPMENFPPEYRLRRKCNLIFIPNDYYNK